MNQDQINALIRETTKSLAALIATFGLLGESMLSTISALVIALAMVIWAMLDKASRPLASLTRTALQAIAPVLVSFSVVTEVQGASITAVLLSLVAVWTTLEKK